MGSWICFIYQKKKKLENRTLFVAAFMAMAETEASARRSTTLL